MRKNLLTWEYTLLIMPLTMLVYLYWDKLIAIPKEYYYFGIPLIITVLIFVIQILQRKEDQSDTQISFIENEGTLILNAVGFDLQKLKLIHEGTPVNKKSILYQATILNSGLKDIDKHAFRKPLAIKLSEKYKWKSIEITYQSKEIGLSYELKNNTLLFKWDLLKINEYFKFDSIIEFKQEFNRDNIVSIFRGILKNISFSGSRIKNVKFLRTNFAKGESVVWKIKIAIPLLMVVALNYFAFSYDEKTVLHQITTKNNDTLCISFHIDKNNNIVLKDSLGDEVDIKKLAYSNWVTRKVIVVDNFSWERIKSTIFKVISWLMLVYLILLLIKRNYFLRRKMINDFIAFPYRGDPSRDYI